MDVREENLNTELATLLEHRGLLATAEVKVHIGKERNLPDVLMRVNGVKVILEGKYDSASAVSQLENQCIKRIERGLAEVSVGMIYDPRQIRSATHQGQIPEILDKMRLKVKIWWYGQQLELEQASTKGWNAITVDGLAAAIRDAVNNVASEDTLARAVEIIEQGVDKMASNLLAL